jgi:hypothetical protein
VILWPAGGRDVHIVGGIKTVVRRDVKRLWIEDTPDSSTLLLCMPDFQITSECTLDVDKGEDGSSPIAAHLLPLNRATWKVGYMQVQTMEVNWAYYRGESDGDGCVFVDKVVNRKVGACRDVRTDGATLWYVASDNPNDCFAVPQDANAAKKAPWTGIWFIFGDAPGGIWEYRTPNLQRRGAPNYLYEFRTAYEFLTVVVQQDEPGKLKFLRHFTWKVVWHGRSDVKKGIATSARDFTLLKDSGFTRTAFTDGPPKNGAHVAILNDKGVGPSAIRMVESTRIQSDSYPTRMRIAKMAEPDKPF